jgi:Skp family chaperone for outer membrane proteins
MCCYHEKVVFLCKKMKKNKALFLALLSCSVAWGNAKIGVVNSMSVQQRAKELKAKVESVSAKQRDIAKEFEACKKTTEAKMKKAQSLSSLKPEDHKKKMAEYQKEFTDKVKNLQEREAALRKEVDKASLDFQEKYLNVVKDVAKEKSVNIVFDQGMLLYADDTVINLTEDVAKKVESETTSK